jgi:hypothetical protein
VNTGTLRGLPGGVRTPRPNGTANDKQILIADSTTPENARWGNYDGWSYDSRPWTFVSATTGAGGGLGTFTVHGNATSYLYPGVKVSWVDTGATKYGVVASSSFSVDTTTVTLIKTSDYTMAAGLTATKYSYDDIPQGVMDAIITYLYCQLANS